MERGSTSLASDQNRPLDSDPNTSPISLSVQDQGTENQNPQEQSMVHPKLYDHQEPLSD